MQLKRINVLNDYVAVMMVPIAPKGVILDESVKTKYTNEGVVIGIGPDARAALGLSVNLGDKVVVRQSNYQVIKPDSGVYAGKDIILAHKPDLVMVKDPVEGDETYQFGD